MKKILIIVSMVLLQFLDTSAQPYSISFGISVPVDCNGGSGVLLYSTSGFEGDAFLIPEQTLPSQLSSLQSHYDLFAGGVIGLEEGTLNENISLNINLEFFKCSPENTKLFELIRMSIQVIGDKTGSHPVFSYYNFNQGKKAFIKLKASKLFEYMHKEGVTLDEIVAWFYAEGFTPDVTGITYKYRNDDPEWFYIYLEHFSKIVLGTFNSPTNVNNSIELPTEYKLEQNFPNPFNPTTTIGFGIIEKGNVRMSILNLLGEEVRVLLNEDKESGYHSIDFNASELPSGVYFSRIQVGNFIDTKKMLLLK